VNLEPSTQRGLVLNLSGTEERVKEKMEGSGFGRSSSEKDSRIKEKALPTGSTNSDGDGWGPEKTGRIRNRNKFLTRIHAS